MQDNPDNTDYSDEWDGDENISVFNQDGEYVLSKVRDTNFPLTSFFEQTKDKAKIETFGAWLKEIDNDTVKMIIQIAEKSLFVQATEDTQMDNDDIADYLCFAALAIGWELGEEVVNYEVAQQAMKDVYFLTVGEDFARKGICIIKGPNSLLNTNKTIFEMTPEGRLIAEKLKDDKNNG